MEDIFPKGKAIWDPNTVDTFCNLCIKEVEAGHRPGTHFDKTGWQNIIKEFNATTGRVYKKLQLKNKWDSLKVDWKLWKQLIGKETGLGWNVQKNTIDAPDEWWLNKIQSNPNLAKFRIRGIDPEFEAKLNRMFMNIVATGEYSWTPSSGIVPSEVEKNSDDHDTPIEELESSGDSDEPNRSEVPIDRKGKRPIEQDEKKNKKARKGKGKGKSKVGGAMKLSQQIDRLVEVVERRSTTTATNVENNIPGYGITKVIQVLDSLPGLEVGSTLYFFAVHLFSLKEKRETFMAIKTPELKLNWLKFEQSLRPGY